ncbi:MAG: ABC transporter permease [Actinomycetaceae bacterium]|nr:ABC transporter permease [Actinomycetaceae bacterium]
MLKTQDALRRSSTCRWLVQRLVRALIQCLIASVVLFVLIQALPGDAATALEGRNGPEAVERARQEMGLDRPVLERYFDWLGALVLRGDLGNSFATGKPVAETIGGSLLATLTVAVIVFVLLLTITLPIGLVTGANAKRRQSRIISGVAVAIVAVPEFVVAIAFLAVLCSWLGWLPVLSVPGAGNTVWQNPICLVMPTLILWIICSAALLRRVQALIGAHADAAYVREAELAGIPRSRVLFTHLFPTMAFGICQILAQTVPYLLGGTVVVETVTSFPGLGSTLVTAIGARESALVMAIGMLMMVSTALAFAVADLLGRRQERVVAVL